MEEHLAAAKSKGQDVAMEVVHDHEMFALQGPKAMHVLDSYVKDSGIDLVKMPFMTAATMHLLGVPCKVVRCGYTGEDGFEISVPDHFAVELWDSLIAKDEVHQTGLGARDSLRLEAGLCLYGNDATRYVVTVRGRGGQLSVSPRRSYYGAIWKACY